MKNNLTKEYNCSIVRMIACIGVLMVHLGQRINLPAAIQPFFDAGSSGVTAFFILSGYFVIPSFSRSVKGKGDTWRWVINKLFRILPVYYFAVAFYFVFYQLILHNVPNDEFGLGWFRYVFCIFGIVPSDEVFWTNLGMTWTIGVFLLLYLLTPVLNKVINSFFGSVICFAFFYILEKVLNHCNGWCDSFRYLQYCVLGIALYYAIKEGKQRILGIGAVLALLFLIIKKSDSALVIAMIAVLFIIFSEGLQVKKKVVTGVLAFFDRYSYCIYLMQGIVIAVLEIIGIHSDIMFSLMFILGTIVLAIGVNFAIERNGVKLGKKLTAK